MKIYRFFKNLGLCALVASCVLPMIGSSGGLTKAQRLSDEAALESGRSLKQAADRVESLAQEAEKAAQDATQATTLEKAQEASGKAFTSREEARELKNRIITKVKEVQALLEQLKIEATNTNQLAVYPLERANEQIAEVEEIAQKAQEAVNRALSASSKASDVVEAKNKAAAAPVVVPTPVTPSTPGLVTPVVATAAETVALQPAEKPEPTPWTDWLLDLPSSAAAAAKAEKTEAEELEDEDEVDDDNDESELSRAPAKELTEAEIQKLYEDLRFQLKDKARLESAPHKSELTSLSIKNAEKKITEIDHELIRRGLETNLTAMDKDLKRKKEAMEKGRLMRLAEKSEKTEPAAAMPEETDEAEERVLVTFPSAAEGESDENARMSSDSDEIRSQRPLYTERGALTPEGHLQRLEQRQAQEEARRMGQW